MRAIAPEAADDAMLTVVAAQRPALERLWRTLSPPMQRMLRAVAAEGRGLTTRDVLDRYGMSSSSHATKALKALVATGMVIKEGGGSSTFDDPFFGRWVVGFAMEGGAAAG